MSESDQILVQKINEKLSKIDSILSDADPSKIKASKLELEIFNEMLEWGKSLTAKTETEKIAIEAFVNSIEKTLSLCV